MTANEVRHEGIPFSAAVAPDLPPTAAREGTAERGGRDRGTAAGGDHCETKGAGRHFNSWAIGWAFPLISRKAFDLGLCPNSLMEPRER